MVTFNNLDLEIGHLTSSTGQSPSSIVTVTNEVGDETIVISGGAFGSQCLNVTCIEITFMIQHNDMSPSLAPVLEFLSFSRFGWKVKRSSRNETAKMAVTICCYGNTDIWKQISISLQCKWSGWIQMISCKKTLSELHINKWAFRYSVYAWLAEINQCIHLLDVLDWSLQLNPWYRISSMSKLLQ